MDMSSRGGAARQAGQWDEPDNAGSPDLDPQDPGFALLARAVQHEIIPRLMLVHRQHAEGPTPEPCTAISIEVSKVQEFVVLLLGEPEQPGFAMLDALREGGVPVETLFLQLLAPAARLLGEYWVEDACDFTEVTVALGRLQRMLNVLSPLLELRAQPSSNGLSILLLTAPGEQHTLGLAMVGEFFRRSGWEVCAGPSTGTAQAVGLLKRRSFDAVGFSLAGVGHVDALAQSIASVRVAAGARPQCIIVGGPVFVTHPEYVTKVGADLVATDAKEAPDLVRQFVKANRASRELLRGLTL